MDNKYNKNLGASSDDRDEAEDLFSEGCKT